MSETRLVFRVHAVQRMFERRIRIDDVIHVLDTGDVIESYPDDEPYPSRLVLGWRHRRPIHVVAAYHAADNETIIITVYEPDPALWDETFRRRRR